jgi:hypothetical protein
MRLGDERCEVTPGRTDAPDLTIRSPATYFLAVHRGEADAMAGLLLGRIRLRGRRSLFFRFPALFGFEPGQTLLHRWLFRVRRWRAKRSE